MNLSEKEREVLAIAAEGLTNEQAAKRLFMSVSTFKRYLSRLSARFDCSNTKKLISFAHNNNLIEKLNQKANRV